MAEWLKATDCKSVLARVRWFESTPAHHLKDSFGGLFLKVEVLVFKLLVSLIVVLLTLGVIIIEPKMHKPVIFGSKPIVTETTDIVKPEPVKISPQNTNLIREEYMRSVKMRNKQKEALIPVEPNQIKKNKKSAKVERITDVPHPVKKSEEKTSFSLSQFNDIIMWNKWRADICNTISNHSLEEQSYSLEEGILFKYSFYVDNNKHITNVHVYLAKGRSTPIVQESIRDIRRNILLLEGKNILTYPEGSKRTSVRVEGGIETAGYNASVGPNAFSDIEFK